MSTGTHALARETQAPDEAALVGEFIAFMQEVGTRRRAQDPGPMRRFNQGRAAGCVEAEFAVNDGLPAEHRVGLFATPGTYPAFLRFASAGSSTDLEKDVRGLAIRVEGVTGENLTAGATTQDFVLNSHPVMVAPDTPSFLAFLRAAEAGRLALAWYVLRHPKTAVIGARARQHHTCHLDIPYFSATPYLFGPGRAVKYIVSPCSDTRSVLPDPLTATYLHDALKTRLAQAAACFDLKVQFQTTSMPIEDASEEWSEQDSPYHAVARIRIPPQDIDDAERLASCEAASFNPWHCLAVHRPLGGMNRARRDIYRVMSQFRSGR